MQSMDLLAGQHRVRALVAKNNELHESCQSRLSYIPGPGRGVWGSGVAGMGSGSHQPPDMRSSSALLRVERLRLLRRRLLELPARTIAQGARV